MQRQNTLNISPLQATSRLLLSIVYVNYCQDSQLLASLSSLFSFNLLHSVGVVVVDNSPSPIPATPIQAQSICTNNHALFSYVVPKSNLGFGKACNLGATIFQADFLLLLNCDTQFIDGSLVSSVQFLSSCKHSVAALGCVHIDSDRNPSFSAYPFIRDSLFHYLLASNPVLYRVFRLRNTFSVPAQPKLVGDISGAFMLIRSSIFSDLCGFNPEFFLYSEDTSFCRDKLIPSGYSIVFYPEARIVHHVGTPSGYTWRAKQVLASEILRRYRQGFHRLLGFTLISLLNYLTLILLSILKADLVLLSKHLRLIRDLFKILFYELPSFLASSSHVDFRVKYTNNLTIP